MQRQSDAELAAYVADYPECPSTPPCPNCRAVAMARELIEARKLLEDAPCDCICYDDDSDADLVEVDDEMHDRECFRAVARALMDGENASE